MAFVDKLKETFPSADADQVLGIIRGTVDPETVPAVETWGRQCYHRPSRHELKMAALDAILGTFGVEAAFEDGKVWPYLEWLNVGDPYVPTVVYTNGRYKIACYGDFIQEAGE